MDREEALRMLRGGRDGVARWNRSRGQGESIPDLSGADLSRMDLRGADLSEVRLCNANLLRTILSDACTPAVTPTGLELRTSLRRANLEMACLEHAQLHNVDLVEADFSNGDLSGAYLNGADLQSAVFKTANLMNAHFNKADLTGANFSDAKLVQADMRGARMHKASLCYAQLPQADLRGADLTEANLSRASLHKAKLDGADLRRAILVEANLTEATATKANMSRSWLHGTLLVRTDLMGADLSECSIYGISAWDVQLDGANQSDLVISPPSQPTVTVDQLEVGQFIYLLLNNRNIRRVIDTITSKVVLILGRFTPARKAVLDALRDELRRHDYLPIVFDFDKPTTRDLTETISILAHLARFILADLTDAKSVPQELHAIVPHLPSVPVQPLLEASSVEYGMFEHFLRYPWVLPICRYSSIGDLMPSLAHAILAPVVARSDEMRSSCA